MGNADKINSVKEYLGRWGYTLVINDKTATVIGRHMDEQVMACMEYLDYRPMNVISHKDVMVGHFYNKRGDYRFMADSIEDYLQG